MPLIKDVGRLFRRRRRPVEIDLTSTQAGGLATTADEPGNGNASGELAMIEPKPVRERRGESRTHQEVLGLVQRIGEHLDQQSQRAERMVELMDRIPAMLDALPEISRQNATLVEALHDHFAQAKRREEALGATLSTITDTSERQTDVLGLIQQQLDSNSHTAQQFQGTLDNLRCALSDLADSNTRSSDVLLQMSEQRDAREAEFRETLSRTQAWTVAAMIACSMVSVAAVIVAAIALFGAT
jgi:chromosome segregation ATPase